jgi:hypothetical protein
MPRKAIYARLKASDPDKVKRDRRAQYLRHKEAEKAAHLTWSRQPHVAERRKERQNRRKRKDATLRTRLDAKGILARSLGCSQKILPADLVDLKVAALLLNRAIKEASQ